MNDQNQTDNDAVCRSCASKNVIVDHDVIWVQCNDCFASKPCRRKPAKPAALDSLMPSSTPSNLGEIVESVKREPSGVAELQAENERLREALADKEEDLRGQHNGTPWDVFKMLTDWAAWSDSVWGEGRSPAGAINHLAQEVDELRSSPQNIMEHVDVIMLAMESLRLAGFDVAELVDAAAKKLEINKQREWGPVDDDGVSQHVGDPSC